jgi:hypothetical protein
MSRIRPVSPGRHPSDYVQSTLRTAPDLCQNISLRRYLVATVIHTQSVRMRCVYICISKYIHVYVYICICVCIRIRILMCVCTCIHTYSFKLQTLVCSKRNKKKWDIGECLMPRKAFRVPYFRQPCLNSVDTGSFFLVNKAARVITYRNRMPRLRVNGNYVHVTTLIYTAAFKQRDCFTLPLKLT